MIRNYEKNDNKIDINCDESFLFIDLLVWGLHLLLVGFLDKSYLRPAHAIPSRSRSKPWALLLPAAS